MLLETTNYVIIFFFFCVMLSFQFFQVLDS